MFQFIKKIIKFFFIRIKYSSKLKFDFSVNISMNSSFGGMNKIYSNSIFDGELGLGSYIAENSFLSAKIGKFCSIARNVSTNNGLHPYSYPFVSTSPAFYSVLKQNGSSFTEIQRFKELKFADNEGRFGVIIGNDCWIGERSFIVGGVIIGDGAVVMAGAVVIKDIEPYAIYGGVPAKFLKYRYDEETIKFLLNFKWWDKDSEWLKANIDLMSNIEMLKNNYNI